MVKHWVLAAVVAVGAISSPILLGEGSAPAADAEAKKEPGEIYDGILEEFQKLQDAADAAGFDAVLAKLDEFLAKHAKSERGFDAKVLKAKCLSRKGDFDGALAQTAAVLEEYKDNKDKKYDLGEVRAVNAFVYEKKGDVEKAREEYQLIVDKFSESAWKPYARKWLNRSTIVVGAAAPEFEKFRPLNPNPDDDPAKEYSPEDFKGKHTLVIFMAAFNQPSLDMVKKFNKEIYPGYKEKENFAVLGVAVDYYQSRGDLSRFLRSATDAVVWPVSCDGAGWHTSLAVEYAVYKIPTMILVDADGKIAKVDVTMEELPALLREQLGEPDPVEEEDGK